MATRKRRPPAAKTSPPLRKKKAKAKAKAKPKARPLPRSGRSVLQKSAARGIDSKRAEAAQSLARRSPGKLRLTMMTGDYEIVRALKEGLVQPKGIELVTGGFPGTRNIHSHVAQGKACDVNEFNGGHYVVQKAHGRDDITAIPVFLHRRFRHGFIYVNTGKGIEKPADLAGRRVACRTIGSAAAYWMREYLQQHGAPHRSITWVIETPDEASGQAPPEMKIEVLPKGEEVEKLVLTGEIDAIIQPDVNEACATGDPRIRRLWPNYKEVEIDYYRRTGFFPIMHVTTVPTLIVEKHPWVVESLTLAFEEAKQLAYQRLANPRNVPLAFYHTYWEEQRALLGDDPWEYGLSEANQRNYGALVGYVNEQVLSGKRPKLTDLFPKEAFELAPMPNLHPIDYRF